MRKIITFSVLALLFNYNSFSQLAVSKIVGKDSDKFGAGYGAFLKFAYPISDGDDLTIEIGANVFSVKDSDKEGIDNVPLKLGYRYTVNREGFGFYVEPSVGYNLYGISSFYYTDPIYGQKIVDTKFNGFIISPSIGYLFKPIGGIQFNLQALYESNFIKGGNLNYAGLRLSHNFSTKKRTF